MQANLRPLRGACPLPTSAPVMTSIVAPIALGDPLTTRRVTVQESIDFRQTLARLSCPEESETAAGFVQKAN